MPPVNDLPEPYARYLRLLGIKGRLSGIKGLREIVLKHLCRVPFENISKLLLYDREGKGRPLSLGEFLDGIEFHDLGGTCHSGNPFLAELLRALGYRAELLGADMSESNVHTCICVKIGSFEYHVDVGYAAPFRKPMRLDRVPRVIIHGQLKYVLDRNHGGHGYTVSLFSGSERLHGYVVHGPARGFDFFSQTIKDSFGFDQAFMSNLRIVRFCREHTVDLKNRTLSYYQGGDSRHTELRNPAELESAVRNELSMPRCPIKKAVEILERVTGKSFFESQG